MKRSYKEYFSGHLNESFEKFDFAIDRYLQKFYGHWKSTIDFG